MELQDLFGRRFQYLRLSVTDACNFRCAYCLPDGYKKPANSEAPLSLPEIKNLAAAFSEMGTWKIRLTGGEPTLRRDLLEIIAAVGDTPGIRKVALSTNGHLLKSKARAFRAAGVSALNVSVDSLDRKRFAEVTGADQLPEVLAGITEALRLGFDSVKVNAVLLAGVSAELESFLAWVKKTPITVRFIELMPTGQNKEFFEKHHVKADGLVEDLYRRGWRARERCEADGPATEFEHSECVGRIGVIAPYSKDFCKSCNRLRVTSQGGLRLCLFGEGSHSVRHLLQSGSQRDELKEQVRGLLNQKEISHYLPEGRYGNNQTFSAMGG